MQLPEQFTKVTTFSKLLAGLLFVSLPFFGFLLGIQYQSKLIKITEDYQKITKTEIKPTLSKSEDQETTTSQKLVSYPSFKGEGHVTYNLEYFNITTPINYHISGDTSNFVIEYNNDTVSNEQGLHRDIAQLHFMVLPLEQDLRSTAEKILAEGIEYGDQSEESKITEIVYGGIKGYQYDCPFLTPQTCIFLPLYNHTTRYLAITEVYSDPNDLGYKKELDTILASLEFK